MKINFPKTYRTKEIEGMSIPGIIKNGNYFFSDLEVYEDGRVNCWKFYDFEDFKNDVKTEWVSLNIPDGKEISIHSLGNWTINNGLWTHNKDSFIDYVWSIIKHLNPKLLNLYTYSEKKVGNITVSENGNGNIYIEQKTYPNDPFPKKIKGKGLNFFLKGDNNEYHLARFDIYNQNSIIINRIETPFEISLPQLEQMVAEQKVITKPSVGTRVHIFGLGSFDVQKENYSVKISEKILEIKDIIKVLNGASSSLELCREFYQQYCNNPSKALKEKLKETYENIPKHQRMYVGNMDEKDIPIRMIIYGEQEIKNWSHYRISEKMGGKLPTIEIPKPKDD